MSQEPLIATALDPLHTRGLRHWLIIGIVASTIMAFCMYLPIFSPSDNAAFRAYMAHIGKQSDQAPSPSWPAKAQQGITFDSQMILEARRCWDDPSQSDAASPALRQLKYLASFSTHLARGETVLIALLLLWLLSRYRKLGMTIESRLLAGFLGLGAAALTATFIKFLIGRGRPNELLWRGRLDWDFLALDHNHHSFPSGHATASGAIVMLMCLLYPRCWPIWLAAGLWLAATRVLMTEHWPSDTLAGLLLGAFSVALMASIVQRRRIHQDSARNHSSSEMVSPLE